MFDLRYETIQKHKKATKITAAVTGIFALLFLAVAVSNPGSGLSQVSGYAVSSKSGGSSLLTWVGILGIVAIVWVTWSYLNSSNCCEMPLMSYASVRKKTSRRRKRR